MTDTFVLPEDIVIKYNNIKKNLSETEGLIYKRISHIVRVIAEIYGLGYPSWGFDDGGLPESGYLYPNDKFIKINTYPYNAAFMDFEGEKINLCNKIPVHWLYSDSFKDEIVIGMTNYLKKEANKQELAKAAREKLTREEIEALGLKE